MKMSGRRTDDGSMRRGRMSGDKTSGGVRMSVDSRMSVGQAAGGRPILEWRTLRAKLGELGASN